MADQFVYLLREGGRERGENRMRTTFLVGSEFSLPNIYQVNERVVGTVAKKQQQNCVFSGFFLLFTSCLFSQCLATASIEFVLEQTSFK